MQTLYFAHSNGFPALTYRYFLSQFSDFDVRYIEMFGHDAAYNPKYSWNPLVKQFLSPIIQENKKVMAVGHSLGAVICLRAYYQNPHLFSHLVLMDPPFFTFRLRLFILLMRFLGTSGKIIPIAKRTRYRQTHWSSKEEAYNYLKNKALFKKFHPECFQDYINFGLKPCKNGVELVFSAEEEYKIFKNSPFSLGRGVLDIPCYYIYSSEFTRYKYFNLSELKNTFHHMKFINYKGNHMFPLEQPEETAQFIRDLLIENTH